MRLLTNSSGTFCYGPCDDPYDYYYPLEDICDDICYGRREFANYTYWICYRSNDTINQITLSKLLHHLRYVDVEFPDKLVNISIMRGTNIFSPRVVYSMFTKVTGWPSRHDLPSVFEYYYLPSSFLANFGDDLILLGMILTIAIIAFILEMVFEFLEGCSEVKLFFYRLRILTQWNLPLMIILHNTGDIFFFAVLEFRTLDLTRNADSIVSFILCLLMLLLLAIVHVLGIYLAERAHTIKTKAKPASYANFIISWEKFQVLFRGFNDSSSLSRSFFFLYGVRLLLPMIIASFLYMIPLLQGIAFFMITACMLLYLPCKKPLRRKVDLVNLFLIEFFILLSDASMIGLISLDMRDSDPDKARTFFGYVIIVCNYCLDVFAGIFMLIKSVITIRKALDFRKQKKESLEVFSWLQLIFIPLQQGSLGFEQFQVYSFSNRSCNNYRPSPEEASQIIDETSSASTTTNKNHSELRGLALPNSGLNQSTIWDLNNSRSHLDGVRISRRRVAPFQPQPRTIEVNTSSLDYIPETSANSTRKRALNSYNSGSYVWTDTEVPQSRTNSSQRQAHPLFEENQELSYNSVMLSHMSVNPLLSQKSFPGSNKNRRAMLNNSNPLRYQPETIEEVRLEQEGSINWGLQRSEGRRTRRRLVRDDDEIYPTIVEDPERNLRFKGNKNRRYNN